jgi:hypothetical protein
MSALAEKRGAPGNARLNENQVIKAMCAYLEEQGYEIISKCTTDERGIDIVAKRPTDAARFLVEAKGDTSADPSSKRYEKGFDRSQTQDHVSKAFYTVACLLQENQMSGDRVAMAYPDTEVIRDFLGRIKTVLETLHISVFLVRPDLSVTVF